MKKVFVGAVLFILLLCGFQRERLLASSAEESSAETDWEIDEESWMDSILEELYLEELDDFSQNSLPEKIQFSDLVEQFCKEGVNAFDGREIAGWIFDIFFYELAGAKDYFLQMLCFTAVFAILKQILDTRSHYISEMSFLMIYGTMMSFLLNSFLLVSQVAEEAITQMIAYLSVLVPVYATVLLVAGNAASAGAFYELVFLIVTLLEWAMKVLLIPGIHIYLLFRFLDQLFEEEKLSRLAELLESGIRMFMKVGLGLVVGFGFVQSLLTPAQDRLSESMVIRSVSAIPGIGGIVGSAGDILLSCGMLIKNSVGAAALIILLVISVTPLIKVFLFTLLYRLMAAVLQPVSDKRIVNCIHSASKGSELYLLLIKDSMLMFFLTVALVTASTSFIF